MGDCNLESLDFVRLPVIRVSGMFPVEDQSFYDTIGSISKERTRAHPLEKAR